MPQDKPSKKSIFRTEEEKQAYLKHQAAHQRKLETDPEYRAKWEQTLEHLHKFAPIGDSEMD